MNRRPRIIREFGLHNDEMSIDHDHHEDDGDSSSRTDPWLAAARELARNPDSPASLRIMSSVRQALAPRAAAADQLVDALARKLTQDGEAERAAVDAAIGTWERACGVKLDPQSLASFRDDARELADRRRRQPPAMDSILESIPTRTDTGYALGVDLGGFDGTWHRLWAMLCLGFSFGRDSAQDDGTTAMRLQFEEQLGRSMSPIEWSALVEHARNHYETVMRPAMDDDQSAGGPDVQDRGDGASGL
jgi:hypothetical protein